MQSHCKVSKHPSYDPLLEGCTAVREPMQVLFAGPLHCILLPNGMYCMYVRDI